MKRNILTLAVGSILVGCVSTPPMITEQTLSKLNDPSMGGIAVQYGPTLNCPYMTLQLINLDTKDNVFASMYYGRLTKSDTSGSKIDIVDVPPGRYAFNYGKCQSAMVVNSNTGGVVRSYKKLNDWFDPFTVNAGEVVYPGSVDAQWISFKTDGLLDVVPDWLMRAPRDHYVVFDIVDASNVVEPEVKRLLPNIKFSKRLLTPKLDKKVAEDILRTAYVTVGQAGESRNPNGEKASRLASAWFVHYKSTRNFDVNGTTEQQIKDAVLDDDYSALAKLLPIQARLSDSQREEAIEKIKKMIEEKRAQEAAKANKTGADATQ